MDIENFLNSRMDEIFTGLLQNNAEYALTYRRYEHLCELTDPVVCQRKDIEISGEECESFALGVQKAIWFFGAETPQSGVILVAEREPICPHPRLAAARGVFALENSAGPAGGQKSRAGKAADEGGLSPHRGRTRPALAGCWQAYRPLHRGHGTRRTAERARIPLPEECYQQGYRDCVALLKMPAPRVTFYKKRAFGHPYHEAPSVRLASRNRRRGAHWAPVRICAFCMAFCGRAILAQRAAGGRLRRAPSVAHFPEPP